MGESLLGQLKCKRKTITVSFLANIKKNVWTIQTKLGTQPVEGKAELDMTLRGKNIVRKNVIRVTKEDP